MNLKKLIKLFLLAFGLAMILFGILSAFFANISAANFILIFIGIVSASFRFLPSNKFTRFYTGGVIAAAIIFLCIIYTIVSFKPQSADGSEDAVIVLGCAVIGSRPSNTMYARTYSAIRYYYSQNSDTVFVVSGGRGPQEDMTEAKAMQKLLLDAGIPQSQILLEEQATSTSENFIYSKKILDEYFKNKPYSAAFVTNDFHCYRAGELAKLHGFKNVRCISAKTPKGAILLCYVREVLAVLKLWILKN